MTFSLRTWATPATLATSLIVGVTGVVLFFHTGGTLSRLAHEWIGFAMLVAVAFHIVLNWRPFKLYLKRPLAQAIMLLGVVVTIATSVSLTSSDAAPRVNPGMLFSAMQGAPLSTVAEVVGKNADTLVAALNGAGYDVTDAQLSIADIADGDRSAASDMLALAFAPAN